MFHVWENLFEDSHLRWFTCTSHLSLFRLSSQFRVSCLTHVVRVPFELAYRSVRSYP
jgi:hypothetical protein